MSAFVNRYLFEFPNLSKLFEPAIVSLPPPFCHLPLLGTRQGFRKSGLSSGKTWWPAASVSNNSSNHTVKRGDLQKDWVENRKIKWVEGEKGKTAKQIKAEDHLGQSWERCLHCFLSVPLSLSPQLPLGYFFVPTCYFQNRSDFLQVFGLLRNGKM